MNLRRIAANAGLALAFALPLGSLLAGPAGAATQNGQVETCGTDHPVLVHTNGSSVWAVSGDAKYQLVAIDGTTYGTFYDKKTDTLVPFGPNPYAKTWAKGNQTSDFTCTGSDHETDPATGAQFDLDFTATLRQVQ